MEYVKKRKAVFRLHSISFSDTATIIHFYDFKEFCWITIPPGSSMELMYRVFTDWLYLTWEGHCLTNNKFHNLFGTSTFHKYSKGVPFTNSTIICWQIFFCNNISFKFSFYVAKFACQFWWSSLICNYARWHGDGMCISISFQRFIFLLCTSVQNNQ